MQKYARTACFSVLLGVGIGTGAIAVAQSCTTQAKATAEQRTEVGAVAFRLAAAVQGDNAAAVRADTVSQLTADFGATESLIESTAAELKGDSLVVTQMYLLDASNRSSTDAGDAEFTCPLSGTAAETDFSISGLPPGRYAFAMVEANGAQPYTLSFLLQSTLLQSTRSGWRLAGFYPHRRTAAGHDGLWYWTTARADTKAGKPWLAWVLYGEADQLLRPANFVATSNLFRLRSELRAATPPALVDGVSEKTPLALAGANGTEFRITGLGSEASSDGKQLNLLVHLRGEGGNDAQAALQRDVAAGDALLKAHPELRSGFDNLWVIAETPGTNPVVSIRAMAAVAVAP